MALFEIGGIITHYCCYQIEADNEQEALENLAKLHPVDWQDLHIQFVDKVDEPIINTKTN